MLGILNSNVQYVTSNLVYYVDAAQTRSYSGSGTNWQDISADGMAGTLFNTPTFNTGNGGYFAFNSLVVNNQYMRTPTGNSKLNIKSGTNVLGLTLSVWVYFPIRDYDQFPLLQGTDTDGNYDYSIQTNGTQLRLQVNSGNFFVLCEANIPDATWCNLVMTTTAVAQNTSTSVTCYKNGVSQSTGSVTMNASTTTNKAQIARGGNTSKYAYARIAVASIHNKTLSATEVLQNYNALKSRFGL